MFFSYTVKQHDATAIHWVAQKCMYKHSVSWTPCQLPALILLAWHRACELIILMLYRHLAFGFSLDMQVGIPMNGRKGCKERVGV